MTPDEFNRLFDTPTRSVFRFEGLPEYAVDREDEDLVAWREGRPQAVRSVKTSPWLARIARQTLDGVDWTRVRHVTSPPSWYVRWEIGGYVESQAAGEEVLLTSDRPAWTGGDFWLIDAGPDGRAHAIVLRYDDEGRPGEHEHVTDRSHVALLERAARELMRGAVPLNRWIVEHRDELAGVRG